MKTRPRPPIITPPINTKKPIPVVVRQRNGSMRHGNITQFRRMADKELFKVSFSGGHHEWLDINEFHFIRQGVNYFNNEFWPFNVDIDNLPHAVAKKVERVEHFINTFFEEELPMEKPRLKVEKHRYGANEIETVGVGETFRDKDGSLLVIMSNDVGSGLTLVNISVWRTMTFEGFEEVRQFLCSDGVKAIRTSITVKED